eukprot:8984159-Pyramimonas_sp.AAC.1
MSWLEQSFRQNNARGLVNCAPALPCAASHGRHGADTTSPRPRAAGVAGGCPLSPCLFDLCQ